VKLYCYHTPGYSDIAEEYFLSSVPDEYDVTVKIGSFRGEISRFYDDHWTEITREKLAFMIDIVKENWQRYFVFSDPDVQFFGDAHGYLSKICEGFDLVAQKANPWGGICTGYFVCHANERTLRFWTEAYRIVDEALEDQAAANRLLSCSGWRALMLRPLPAEVAGSIGDRVSGRGANRLGLLWRFLPLDEFFLAGARTGTIWSPGVAIDVPETILMHHASWVVGHEHKVAQLEYVRRLVRGRARG
jgi:hypothetical protein